MQSKNADKGAVIKKLLILTAPERFTGVSVDAEKRKPPRFHRRFSLNVMFGNQ